VASRQSRVTDTTQGRKARFSYMPNGFGRTDIITCCALGKGLSSWLALLSYPPSRCTIIRPSIASRGPSVKRGRGVAILCAFTWNRGKYLFAGHGRSLVAEFEFRVLSKFGQAGASGVRVCTTLEPPAGWLSTPLRCGVVPTGNHHEGFLKRSDIELKRL
jgi:hypothetical protein